MILEAPDIVNPFNVKEGFYIDRNASQDLSLDVLLNSVSFRGKGIHVAEDVLKKLTYSHETITYRQDVFQELISDEELRGTVYTVAREIQTLSERLSQFKERPCLKSGLELLRNYISFINDLPSIDSANSKALHDVHTYFGKVRDSDLFREMCDLVARIENLGGVRFNVSLDKDGTPISMSALELIEMKEEKPLESQPKEKMADSFWQRILQRRKKEPELRKEQESVEGQALIHGYGLNHLGGEIRSFIEVQFTSLIIEYSEQIKEVTRLTSPLCFYTGLSEYFVKLRENGFDICRPTLLPKEERRAVVVHAKNPAIVARRRNGQIIVPNDIRYGPDENMFIITGPNNGGKTTYVKTVGLVQVLAQSGSFVPAESAEVSIVDGIYTHFVAPDDITEGEGRYRNELMRMKHIFEHASPFSLVILDEPCGGTSYEEGQRQSLVLLDGFHKLGAATYFTTHMHPVARAVDAARFSAARNISVDCIDDGEKLTYTFKIKAGASGKSYGEEIAREIGLRPENIAGIISQRAENNGYARLLRK